MPEDPQNEMPKLSIRSLASKGDKDIPVKKEAPQSSLDKAEEKAQSSTEETQDFIAPPLDPEATLVIPHQAQGNSDADKTIALSHSAPQNPDIEKTAIFNHQAPSSVTEEEEEKPKKNPLKLARPNISNHPNQQGSLPEIESTGFKEIQVEEKQEDFSFQENILKVLQVEDGQFSAQFRLIFMGIAGLFAVVSLFMGIVSFIPALIFAFGLCAASIKLGNQQFFLKGIGPLLGRGIFTALFFFIAIFMAFQVSNSLAKTPKFFEAQSNKVLDKLDNVESIDNPMPKAFTYSSKATKISSLLQF